MIKKPKFGQLVYFNFQDKIFAGHISEFYPAKDIKYQIRVGNYGMYYVLPEKLFAKKTACKRNLVSDLCDRADELQGKIDSIEEKLTICVLKK